MDAVISLDLTTFYLSNCRLHEHSATQFARLLLGAPRLTALLIRIEDHLFDPASVPAFAAALRASSLTKFRCESVHLWRLDGVGSSLVDALVGHLTLRELSLAYNACGPNAAACLARLVAANSPSLHTLSLAYSFARDVDMQPFCWQRCQATLIFALLCCKATFFQCVSRASWCCRLFVQTPRCADFFYWIQKLRRATQRFIKRRCWWLHGHEAI